MRTLIYDGQCRLCVTAKEGLERLAPDPQHSDIQFVPYQSEEAACRLGSEYKPGRPDVAFLVEPDGTISRGLHEKGRSEEHTSELQSPCNLVCRLLLEKKKKIKAKKYIET